MEPFFFSRLFAVDRCKFSDDYSMVGNDPDKVSWSHGIFIDMNAKSIFDSSFSKIN